ncbi:MAG: sulfatase-like hydrolase/transferase [Burkholderiaceae bacterium]
MAKKKSAGTRPTPRRDDAVVASRYRVLAWVAIAFVLVNVLVRVGLAVFEVSRGGEVPWLRLPQILGVGLLYDLAALAYAVVPFALLALAWPAGRIGRLGHGVMATLLAFAALGGMLFVAVSECLFWNEFSNRFNFIAVDYLIYTREVIGNIRESYPVAWVFAGIGAAVLAAAIVTGRWLWRGARGAAGPLRWRFAAFLGSVGLAVASFFLVGDGPRIAMNSPALRELSANGYYEFMRAFRSNNLDYAQFYRTVARGMARRELRREFEKARSRAVPVESALPIEREVKADGEPMPWNLVLVSIENLGADYVESYGGRRGLTPNLDRLAREGMKFERIYATGLRTVRGLEALTLSVPPTPGRAVPVRSRLPRLQSLGGVLAGKGYDALYLYGGYSYFDNMRVFFEGNGYEVIDRTDIPADRISHENIWGVADEDIYAQAIREIDRRHANGQRVFAHIMTTSNHRPFTFPPDRIDMRSGSGRDAAVKYTDWAIGHFMAEARKRPWFGKTLFVFVADHTSHGRGRTDLPPEHYHIPMVIYGPGLVAPTVIATLASQIDVAPTVLALLKQSYRSQFYGQDILTEGPTHQRAFMANYQTVGYLEDGLVVELSPRNGVRVRKAESGEIVSQDTPRVKTLVDEAVAWYQVAAAQLQTQAGSGQSTEKQ